MQRVKSNPAISDDFWAIPLAYPMTSGLFDWAFTTYWIFQYFRLIYMDSSLLALLLDWCFLIDYDFDVHELCSNSNTNMQA